MFFITIKSKYLGQFWLSEQKYSTEMNCLLGTPEKVKLLYGRLVIIFNVIVFNLMIFYRESLQLLLLRIR